MTNKYMFFNEQKFEGFDLNGYEKNDISIPKTDIHIYDFSCKQANDEDTAKKLDELTQRLEKNFKDQFITVCSESSQFFCSKLYPLIVNFETKLRYALYISRSLFENGNVNKDSFLIDDANKKNQKKKVEEAEFGDFYKFVFSPENFYTTLKTLINSEQMTKSEYIEKIKSLDDSTMWQNWVGDDYNFIQENFIAIKDFRNDVMHNHLIDFKCYKEAKEMLKKANDTLDRAINDKLIVNDSKYLNDVNIFETLSSTHKNHTDNGLVGALAIFAAEAKYYEELQKTSALSEAAKASATMFHESSALAEAAKASAMLQESHLLEEATKASTVLQNSHFLEEAAKASTVLQNSHFLEEAAKASTILRESHLLEEATKASTVLQNPHFLEEIAKTNAILQESHFEEVAKAIAMSAAENLANKNLGNDLKGVSDKTTKQEADDNSPPTQHNDDENKKNPSDMEDQDND